MFNVQLRSIVQGVETIAKESGAIKAAGKITLSEVSQPTRNILNHAEDLLKSLQAKYDSYISSFKPWEVGQRNNFFKAKHGNILIDPETGRLTLRKTVDARTKVSLRHDTSDYQNLILTIEKEINRNMTKREIIIPSSSNQMANKRDFHSIYGQEGVQYSIWGTPLKPRQTVKPVAVEEANPRDIKKMNTEVSHYANYFYNGN